MPEILITPRRKTPLPRDPREVMRDEMWRRDAVLAALRAGPLTVPEIAAEIGAPTHEVMQWVMAAWRYGLVTDAGLTDDDYCRYTLVEGEAS